MEYLVESALLTHGLKSVSNETIKKEWQDPGKKITWIDHGEIRIGDIDEFLEFRSRAAAYPRIDCDLLEKVCRNHLILLGKSTSMDVTF